MLQLLIDRICKLFGFLMVACLGLMVLMVFGNVVLRYVFNSGIVASEELSRWLFVWMTFLGAIVAIRRHAHLGTDALISRLPRMGRKLCFVAAHLLMIYMCWLMARGGWQQAVINLQTTSAVMEVSMAWFQASGVVFAILGGLLLVNELWMLFTGQLDESDLIGVRESDDVPTGEPHP